MKWLDKLFGSSGSSHDYDGEGYYHDYPLYNSGGWHEPDFLSVLTRFFLLLVLFLLFLVYFLCLSVLVRCIAAELRK
jgi:hypothetical protein